MGLACLVKMRLKKLVDLIMCHSPLQINTWRHCPLPRVVILYRIRYTIDIELMGGFPRSYRLTTSNSLKKLLFILRKSTCLIKLDIL